MPKFVLKEMDSLYVDEMRSSINQLMVNLESQPVSKGGADSKYGLQKLKKYNHRSVLVVISNYSREKPLEKVQQRENRQGIIHFSAALS